MVINADTPRNRFIKSLAKQYVKLCSDYGVIPTYEMEHILLFQDDYQFDDEFKGEFNYWPDSITLRVGVKISPHSGHSSLSSKQRLIYSLRVSR